MEQAQRISNMDALLYVLILEVVLLQMKILEKSAFRDVLSNLDKRQKRQRDKLYRDRIFAKDVIRRTLLEIAENGQYLTLYQAVEILNKPSSTFTSLLIDNNRLKTLKVNYNQELITKRYHRDIQLRDCDENIAFLKDEIKDSLINTTTQLSYAEKYVSATAEALELRFQVKPISLPREDHEQRTHNEIIRIYNLQTEEREELFKYWKTKYHDDIINITDQVKSQREKLLLTVTRRLELQKLFDYHAGEIRAWLTFKSERAARLARVERAKVAATKIQSWWRGLMVRRALGAFRHLRNSKKISTKNKKK
ncbi:dynein regulatory complex protein 9-like [Battus philenor]|uniref:dynein regulatory complex protein 9-like n=1 Tax=Battus philenor TaxID=42288 RepID=UPI0035CFC547